MDNKILFSEEHIWVMESGGSYRLGITDYALEQLGNIMFLNLPEEGELLEQGKPFGEIEGIKTVADLISPANGKVLCVNQELVDNPEKLQGDPFENWLLQAEIEALPSGLMDADAYYA